MDPVLPQPDAQAGSPAQAGRPEPPCSVIAVSATFTAEALEETLAFWMKELGWGCEVRFAPYNQVFQQLLDSGSLLAHNRNGVNALLVRLEDWARFDAGRAAALAGLEENVSRFISAVQSASRSFASPLLVCLCPASPGFLADPASAAFQIRMEERIEEGLRNLGSVYLSRPQELVALYPVDEPHDPHGDKLGHIPYTPELFASLATLLARKIHALRMAPYKVIVLDCDETLWQGICGEDGPQGIVVDPPRRALQEFMLAQREQGMLLCLCSKNNPEDVFETFRLNPDMPLRLEHFAAWRINWEPKSANLAELADELQLGLDSFILVDDNPKECNEVQANLPEVLALTLPADAAEIPLFLRHVWAFDHVRVTEEDRTRAALYAQQAARGRAEKQAASLEEFLATLELEVRIAPVLESELPRVAQLTQRTNQMNFTTVRRTESELQALLQSGLAECLAVHVSDRFGSYGLTGVVLFAVSGDRLVVDSFLLSCRALGRGVEHRMLAELGRIALDRGLAYVEAPFVRSQRNLPALLFLESVGAEFQQAENGRMRFLFPAARAAGTSYKPSSAVHKPAGSPAPRRGTPGAAGRKPLDYASLATLLREPARILERLRGANHRTRPGKAAPVPPRTELEGRLAAIWAEMLSLPSVGVYDNFFDLGGHSLMAVQLLSRVRQELGVDLSLEVVYTGDFTVAELAKAIELKEIERAGAGEYQALLEELEGLSDEEVRALLAKEGGGPS